MNYSRIPGPGDLGEHPDFYDDGTGDELSPDNLEDDEEDEQ